MSDLKNDLFKRHLRNDPSCTCRFQTVNAHHYFTECPLYNQYRDKTLNKLPNDVKYDIYVLIYGCQRKSQEENLNIMTAVSKYIRKTGRFAEK